MSLNADLKHLLEKWQQAMRLRDNLINLLEGLQRIREDAGLDLSTIADVQQQLDIAEAEVLRLQTLFVGPDKSG